MDNTSSCSICAAKPVLEEMRPMLAQAEATLQRHLPPTNDPPGSADTYALKSSLLDFRRTLSHVNGSILEADAEVSHMKTMRDNLQTIIHRIETVLHPVRSLAPSILLTIFEWCIPLPTDTIVIYQAYDSLDPASAPWRLSSVCRRWRDIVLSSPRMWSLVSLPMTNYADPPPFPLMFRLGQHLQRSTNVELDIVLFDATRFGSDGALITTSAQHSILPLLLTTTKRWRSFMITCIRTLLDLFTGCPFDQLVCLRMDFLGRVDSDDVISCFQHSAQITHVSVSHAGKVEFPWDGILSYECGIDAGLSRIPQMSSLEQLTIRHYVEDFVVSSFFPIRLPSLLRLSIIDLSPSFALALEDVLQTPVLHTIRLHFTLTTFTFPRFRQSPPFCLKNLSIVMYISPMDRSDHLAQLVMFFEMAPHITNLYMSKCVVIPEVLDALSIVKEESGHLLPQLKSLRLDAETIKDDCDRVITLANSRLEELRVVGDLDREWPEDQRESGEASRWRGFCDRVRVIHVLEDDF